MRLYKLLLHFLKAYLSDEEAQRPVMMNEFEPNFPARSFQIVILH